MSCGCSRKRRPDWAKQKLDGDDAITCQRDYILLALLNHSLPPPFSCKIPSVISSITCAFGVRRVLLFRQSELPLLLQQIRLDLLSPCQPLVEQAPWREHCTLLATNQLVAYLSYNACRQDNNPLGEPRQRRT